jgi:hypothetical protein
MTTRKIRISPALVISCVALFVALTGSAIAAGVLGPNTVRSPQIVNETVRNADLHDGLIGASKLSPGAVTETAIADNAVGSAKVADGSLSEADLGPNSVGSSELQAGSIRASELGPMIQVTNSTNVAPNGNTLVTATCPAGTTVISGGGLPSSYAVYLVGSVRSGNGWTAYAHSTSGANTTLTAYAYCLVGGSSN